MSQTTEKHSSQKQKKARLEGTTAAGGPKSRQMFSKLLGISACRAKGFKVDSVAWVNDHVEIGVVQPDTEPVIFSLEREQQGRPSYMKVGSLSIYYQGPSVDPLLDAALRAVASRTFAKSTIEDLAALIGADPDTGKATEPLPNKPEEDQKDYEEQALLATWGSQAVWTSFFAVAEVARSQLDSLDFFNRCTFVQHCDLECLAVNPQFGVDMVPVVHYPWENHIRKLDWSDFETRSQFEYPPDMIGMITTDLDERSVILGHGPQRLEAALNHLKGKNVGSMVFCSTTCVPVVAGEDVDSITSKFSDQFDVPLICLTTTPQSMQGVFRELLVKRRQDAEKRITQQRKNTVNLVGFAVEPALEELKKLLREIGINVNATVLPSLSPELIDKFPNANFNVLHPNELWRGHYDQLLFDSKLTAITPPAPYGRVLTVEWIEAIAEEFELEVNVREKLSKWIEKDQAEWEELVEKCKGNTLGFILRATDKRHLIDPAQTWGIPLLTMIEEMGFNAEVLLFSQLASEAETAAEDIREKWNDPEKIKIQHFEDRDQLRTMLVESDASAFYSEHFYDRRLTETGHASFSGKHFEKGFLGALRTIRRLLEVCNLPFSKRYGKHLARAALDRDLADAFGLQESP